MLPLQKNTAMLLLYENNKCLKRKMHFVPQDCRMHSLMSTEQRKIGKLLESVILDVLMWKRQRNDKQYLPLITPAGTR